MAQNIYTINFQHTTSYERSISIPGQVFWLEEKITFIQNNCLKETEKSYQIICVYSENLDQNLANNQDLVQSLDMKKKGLTCLAIILDNSLYDFYSRESN